MKPLKEIAQAARSAIVAKYLDWKFTRESKQFTEKKMLWFAGATGGQTLTLGYMTRKEAIREISLLDFGSIIFVDDEVGFIAVRSKDDPRKS